MMNNDADTNKHFAAQTAWKQISVMCKMACGAREATVNGNVLMFKVGMKPMHYVRVTLDATDTYTVEHFRLKRGSYAQISLAKSSDIYAEQLSSVIRDQVDGNR